MLQNSFGKPMQNMENIEERRNIFLESTAGKKSEGSSAAYSPNLGLDLRLEIDRLKSDNRELTDLNETLSKKIDCIMVQNFLWKLEGARLSYFNEELNEKVKKLHSHLEEATKSAGNPSDRENDLENQLESLLCVNQKNLESLKYSKMSLEKVRKRCESITAENTILKMTLKAMAIQSEKKEQQSSNFENKDEFNKLINVHKHLQEKYAILQKQNLEQASFARVLDNQVNQMTNIVQAAKESETKVILLLEENRNLKIALKKKDEQIESNNMNINYSGNKESQREARMSRKSNQRSENETQKDENNTQIIIIKSILEEFNSVFNQVGKDHPAFYECEIVKVKIQSLSRSIQVFYENSSDNLNETLQNVLVLPPPKAPTLNTILNSISVMSKAFDKLFGGYLSQTGSKWASRTRSESKNPPRNSDEDMIGNNDQSSGQSGQESPHKQQIVSQLAICMRQAEELAHLNQELQDRINSTEDDNKVIGDRLKEAESELREKVKDSREKEKEIRRLTENERKNIEILRDMERKFEQFRNQIVEDLQITKQELKVAIKERDDLQDNLMRERKHLEEVKQKVEQLDEDTKGRDQLIEKLTSMREQRDQDCLNYQNKISNLTNKLSEIESELTQTNKALSHERQAISEMQASFKDLSSQYETLRLQSQTQHSQVQSNTVRNAKSNSSDADLDCDIDDIKDFVRSMKRDADYQSNSSSQIEELKAKNRKLMVQLMRAEEAQAASLSEQKCNSNYEEVVEKFKRMEKENSGLIQDLRDLERTCQVMRDKLEYYENLKGSFEELQRLCIDKDKQIHSLMGLTENMNDKINYMEHRASRFENYVLPHLNHQINELRKVKEGLIQTRNQSGDIQRIFSSRIGSLISLFRSEAEIAPKGTLERFSRIKDAEDRSRGAQKYREEELRGLESENKVLVGKLREIEKRLECVDRDQEAAQRKIEESQMELKESSKRERILRDDILEVTNENKKLLTMNESLAKAIEKIGQQKKLDEDIKQLKARLQQSEAKCKSSHEKIDQLEKELEEYRQSRDEGTELITQLTLKLSEVEERNAELEEVTKEIEKELTKKKSQLKDVLSNKENIRSSDNNISNKMKEMETQIEIMHKKMEIKDSEIGKLKQK